MKKRNLIPNIVWVLVLMLAMCSCKNDYQTHPDSFDPSQTEIIGDTLIKVDNVGTAAVVRWIGVHRYVTASHMLAHYPTVKCHKTGKCK